MNRLAKRCEGGRAWFFANKWRRPSHVDIPSLPRKHVDPVHAADGRSIANLKRNWPIHTGRIHGSEIAGASRKREIGPHRLADVLDDAIRKCWVGEGRWRGWNGELVRRDPGCWERAGCQVTATPNYWNY